MRMNPKRRWALSLLLAGALAGASAPASADEILGKKVLVKNPGSESQRVVVMLAKETSTDITPFPDMTQTGAFLSIVVDGTVQQVIFLSSSGWSAIGGGYKYGPVGSEPVKKVLLKYNGGNGKALMKVILKGKVGTDDLSVVPPNPGTQIGFVLDTGGQQYCASFGGAAGGTEVADSPAQWKISGPTIQPGCPDTTACCSLDFSPTCYIVQPWGCASNASHPAGGVCDSGSGSCTVETPAGGGDCCPTAGTCFAGPQASADCLEFYGLTAIPLSECTPAGCTASAAACSEFGTACGSSCGGNGICLLRPADGSYLCGAPTTAPPTICASDADCAGGEICLAAGLGGVCVNLCP